MKGKSKAVDPQLKKDPAFLKRVERILEEELQNVQDTGQEKTIADTQAVPPEEVSSSDSSPKLHPEEPKKRRGKTSKKSALLKELEELLPQLDEEGLAFLLEQGRIHLYNMKVDELNALTLGTGNQATAASRKKPASVFQIKASSGGGSYHVVYQGNWKLFSDTEMLRMVTIVHADASREEKAGRLFHWLRTERLDVLQDIPFQGALDPLFLEFFDLLQKTFTIRNQ